MPRLAQSQRQSPAEKQGEPATAVGADPPLGGEGALLASAPTEGAVAVFTARQLVDAEVAVGLVAALADDAVLRRAAGVAIRLAQPRDTDAEVGVELGEQLGVDRAEARLRQLGFLVRIGRDVDVREVGLVHRLRFWRWTERGTGEVRHTPEVGHAEPVEREPDAEVALDGDHGAVAGIGAAHGRTDGVGLAGLAVEAQPERCARIDGVAIAGGRRADDRVFVVGRLLVACGEGGDG